MANNSSSEQIFFQVQTWNTGSYLEGYWHLRIDFFKGYNKVSALSYSQKFMSITWQSDNRGEDVPASRWYAGKFEIETENIDDLVEGTKLAKRIVGKDGNTRLWNVQPSEIFAIVAKFATEVIYDKRLGDFVEMGLLAPEGWSAFVDDNNATGESYPQVKVMAPDVHTAKRNIRLALVNSGNDSYFAKWITMDKPVRRCEAGLSNVMDDFRTGAQKCTQAPWEAR